MTLHPVEGKNFVELAEVRVEERLNDGTGLFARVLHMETHHEIYFFFIMETLCSNAIDRFPLVSIFILV